MPKRKRPYRRWTRETMGNWRDPKANAQTNAERFATARIGMIQEALRRAQPTAGATRLAPNSPQIAAYNNLRGALQQSQGMSPQERWRMLSQALAAYTVPGQDPRATLYDLYRP